MNDETDKKKSTLRSIESRVPVKIVICNTSKRTVTVNWINYEGNEVLYGEMNPFHTRLINTYATHPWIFRDSQTKMLAIFDAFVTDPEYLLDEQNRFQTASRILFPKEYQSEQEFNLITIKNGVHSLQEICLDKLLKIYPPTDEIFKQFLPNYFKEITEGQSYQEFLN